MNAKNSMAGNSDADKYALSSDENRRIFEEEIVTDWFSLCRPQEKPIVVFLVAQPGAGKSRVASAFNELFKNRGCIADIDSDLYKPYHPGYDRIMSEDDTLIARYIRPDGRKWMSRAHEHVQAYKKNALIQETAQDPVAVASVIAAYRSAGFRIEIMALGVARAMSDQGILNRYHEQVKDRGHGRLTAKSNAEESYMGILHLAELVEREKLADSVAVVFAEDAVSSINESLDLQNYKKGT